MSEHKAECLRGVYFHLFTQWVLSTYLGMSVTILGLGLLNPLLLFDFAAECLPEHSCLWSNDAPSFLDVLQG